MSTNNHSVENLKARACHIGLYGVVSKWDELRNEPWLAALIECEEAERGRRSLERRTRNARLGKFKLLADFDWSYPTEVDRDLVDQLLTLEFVTEPANVLIVGQNGAGKTMIAKNLAHHAVVNGYSALFISASELLNDLAAQSSGSALTRRLRHYCRPQVLVIDELGYLASSNEHADLLFELVTRRYQQKPIILTSNKPFAEWTAVFPNASCVVALVDRLIHKAEVLKITVDESYRLKEARQRADLQSAARTSSRKKKAAS